jgi:hypothetical protein
VVILTQDRCIVCVERTIGLEIVLAAPDEAQLEARFVLFALDDAPR